MFVIRRLSQKKCFEFRADIDYIATPCLRTKGRKEENGGKREGEREKGKKGDEGRKEVKEGDRSTKFLILFLQTQKLSS